MSDPRTPDESTEIEATDEGTAMQPVLGSQLREVRRRLGYSLSDVAARTSISRSFLALVESGRSDITISRLMRLVSLYGISLADLLPHNEPVDPIIVRRDARRLLDRSSLEGLDYFLAAPSAHRAMMPTVVILEPRAAMAEHARHEGEEFLYILEGTIMLEIEDAGRFLLEQGDTAYYDSNRGHAYKNVGAITAQILAVVTPPSM
jgi:XRE family transcriptional regulator, regulator of sulfur utilization